jgi:hypothetical protein
MMAPLCPLRTQGAEGAEGAQRSGILGTLGSDLSLTLELPWEPFRLTLTIPAPHLVE